MRPQPGRNGEPQLAASSAKTWWEHGYRVFPLHGFLADPSSGVARCLCGRPNCDSPGKHPQSRSWQHTPVWDVEQIEAMARSGAFVSGYGVLCRSLLVIDVDSRNGGIESYSRLHALLPEISGAGLIVETGSGGGSRHFYYRLPESGAAYVQRLPEFPGLDFKTSGFVVGPGSQHASGIPYRVGYGSVTDIDTAPPALLALLARPERHRAEYNGHTIDVSDAELVDLLRYVDNNALDYEKWLRVGMAIHHATAGTGAQIWLDWCARTSGAKHDPAAIQSRWHSFGRSANPVTLGTIVHYAEQAGWVRPVEFGPSELTPGPGPGPEPERTRSRLPFDLTGIDLTCPPGFVGELTTWIESQGRRPRRNLAVAAAITALGNVAGLRYTDDLDGVTTNCLTFCVAGSRTGKEAILQAVTEIHRVAGIAPATHGAIKSEQEVLRNLTRHQAALYLIDEIGIFLQKIKNAQKRGGAAYLDGVIGVLMSAYSKAAGFLLITGDLREDLRTALTRELAAINGQIDRCEGPRDVLEAKTASIERALAGLDNGLERPFLSLLGFTTPVTFEDLVDLQAATNGFIGRALLFREADTAPRSKPNWTPTALPTRLALTLADIYGGGEASCRLARVEYYGPRTKVPTEAAAVICLRRVLDWLEDQAVANKSTSGLEALYLGAYELVSKISLVLAVPEGLRTVEHVRWAFALVKRDVESKVRLVTANEDEAASAHKSAIVARITNLIEGDGETIGVIANRLRRKYNRADVQSALDQLVKNGVASAVVIESRRGQRPTTLYRLAE